MAMPLGLPSRVSKRGSMLILLFAAVAGHGAWYSYTHIPQVGGLAEIQMFSYGLMAVLAIALYLVYPRR